MKSPRLSSRRAQLTPADQFFRVAAALGVSFSLAASFSVEAGDILRGGASAGAGTGNGRAVNPNSVRSEAVTQNGRDSLRRTTQAVAAMHSMQTAARALAVRNAGPLRLQGRALPPVPDGLVPGGLKVAPGVPVNLAAPKPGENAALWTGALLPKQTVAGGKTTVTIKQTKAQAVLNWETFNVGKKTTLRFDQDAGGESKSKWIAFNKVNDPSGVPSQILGSIEAPGQVYIINRNGIIFGGSSQINLRSLVATTLPLNDNLLQRGILNNPDAQFLLSALPLAAGTKGTPAFNPIISDRAFAVSAEADSYTLAEKVALNAGDVPVRVPEFTFMALDGAKKTLLAGTDFTLTTDAASRKVTATFSAHGLARIGEARVTVSYTPVVVNTGDIIVHPGARIASPVSADGNGGRVLLAAPNVRNDGTISTPAGQTILAAGRQVGLDAHKSSDPSLRGLDVYVGAVDVPGVTLPPAGTATNAGLIEVPRGNVTVIGKTVQQLSVIESSTSTALNGRIDLLADYGALGNTQFDATKPGNGPVFNNNLTGTVEIGRGSTIRILPELDGTDRAVGTKLALASQVNIAGQAVHFAFGSTLLAPNADVTVSAGKWVPLGVTTVTRFTSGQIYFDPGAVIDVAGSTDITAPMSQNLLTVQLRGAELAGAPLQRAGLLRGPEITVDLRNAGIHNGFYWIGTPLADVAGYVGIIQRSVGELTAAGGTVKLSAGESVVMRAGSKIDVSGGWTNFEAGMVQTTRVWSGGRLLDLVNATPDLVYDGIYTGKSTFTSAKYGITESFTNPLALNGAHWEEAYQHGANAGTISISAPSMALDGALLGKAIQGSRQQNATTFAPATRGSLTLNFQADQVLTPYLSFSPAPPEILFAKLSSLPAVTSFAVAADGTPEPLREERKKAVVLSPDLLAEDSFGTLAIDNSDGAITIPEGIALIAPMRGSITLRAANLSIGGSVSAPGGTLSFSVFNLSPYALRDLISAPTRVLPTPDLERGIFILGPAARLDTTGSITDYRPGGADELGNTRMPPLVDGGSIAINAFTADLAPGSVIDVSGGVSISATGRSTYGAGGSITINAGNEPGFRDLFGGRLRLGSTLRGFSGGKGGALTIQAPLIQIGGTLPPLVAAADPLVAPSYFFGETEVSRDELLYLTPEFFSQGGFTSFTLNGLGKAIIGEANQFLPGVVIAPGTVLRPRATSVIAVPGAGAREVTLQSIVKEEGLRNPVSLAFGSSVTLNSFLPLPEVALRGDLVLSAGAVIETDPGASVTFAGSTVAILGAVMTPGGKILVSGAGAFSAPIPGAPTEEFKRALPTVHLGPQSILSTVGKIVLTPDAFGRRIGSVLPGGTITVSGNIVAEAGALLDVSGAVGDLDLTPLVRAQDIGFTDSLQGNRLIPLNSGVTAPLANLQTVSTRVESDAGSITLRGGQELFTDATLRGAAGGPSARGGSLSISSGRYIDPAEIAKRARPLDPNLIVTQSGTTLPVGFYPSGDTAIGHFVPVGGSDARLGRGRFAADSFIEGGFDSLTLSGLGEHGAVQFSGPVSISARGSLTVSDGGVIFADSDVLLQAPYVALGKPFQLPLLPSQVGALSFPSYFLPTSGSGRLTVRADLIDVGTLSLQGISRASLIADGGDIRGNGTLNIAGQLTLRAGQVYPTTAGRFTITAYDPNIAVLTSATDSKQVTLASSVLPPGFGVGSPLLGSKVASIDGAVVMLEANASTAITESTLLVFAPGKGSVTVVGSGTRALPLSAGGTLSIYASEITQGGTLRAPLGTINLGWDGTGTSPVDYLTGVGLQPGRVAPITQTLTLSGGSVTSVSAVDPSTGEALLIPYGFSPDGETWIDPTGAEISAGGVPQKAVNLGAISLSAASGSLVDVSGGGDLYAFRWISGNGGATDLLGAASVEWDKVVSYTAGQLVTYKGATFSARRDSEGVTPTISLDWTQVPQSFAVLPAYEGNFAPYAPFNDTVVALNLAAGQMGYGSPGLAVGDRITLGASRGLDAGTYTLLPARYALLPGAVLLTPQAGSPIGTFQMPEGASIVSGFRFNDLNAGQNSPARAVRFEVAPSEVFRERALYDDFSANTFLAQRAEDLDISVPRLPMDSGRVIFSGINALRLDGDVAGRAIDGGYGAEIDINTLADVRIGGAGASGRGVVLDAGRLSSWGADSLLIGGKRTTTAKGITIQVNTSHITVNNAGTPLAGPEIILAAKTTFTLAPGAVIEQSGSTRGADLPEALPLLIGSAATIGSGNGVLLRVSDTQVPISRAGISSQVDQAALTNPPVLTIGAGANISATALTLDSTYGTRLDPSAVLVAERLALNSGQISLAFTDPGKVPEIAGLMLSGRALQNLKSARSLSLLSYSSIDLYGTGTFTADGTLALHAAQIRGFNNGIDGITFAASSILLDNSAGGIALSADGALQGTLAFEAGTVRLGKGAVRLDQFADVEFQASSGLIAAGNGSLTTQGAMELSAPVITAAQAADYAFTAAGALDLIAPRKASGGLSGGLGATLSFTGASLTANTNITLPSGSLTLRATTDDLVIGDLESTRLAAGGTQQVFNDLTRYTGGGRISLMADVGSVTLGAKSMVDVAAQPGGGDAGSLSIHAAGGTFSPGGKLDGRGSAGGTGGSFSLDVRELADVTPLDAKLNAAGLDEGRTFRVRVGDVLIGGLATARSYHLSADSGSVTVNGSGIIDASGETGGKITLQAFGSVTLLSGAELTVAGEDFNSAGKGGAISLEAGSQRDGVVGTGSVSLKAGATIDLSVASKIAGDITTPGTSAYLGQFSGTLHLRAPQNAAGTDLLIDPLAATITDASSIVVEGYRLFDLTNTNGAITNSGTINAAGGLMTAGNNVRDSIDANAKNFLGTDGSTTAGYTTMLNRLLGGDAQGLSSVLVLAPGAEIIHRTGNLMLGASNSSQTADWNLATFRYGPQSAAGVLTMRAAGNLVFFNALSDGFTPTLDSSSSGWLVQAELSAYNPLLPANAQSWSYRLAAGADLSAADFRANRPLLLLGGATPATADDVGSLQLGKLVTTNSGIPVAGGGRDALTSEALTDRFQVIRTGSGDIEISAGRDVQLLNQFATIYTAGTRVEDATLGGKFEVPQSVDLSGDSPLGSVQQNPLYAAQYSLGGGNVTIAATRDIKHQTLNGGVLVADSQKQIPNNWLYRRGQIDPVTGEFALALETEFTSTIASTTWWVDFSNFFEGIGTLGGGNISLIAGRDVSNVDAAAPTNARMTFQTETGDRQAANQPLLELGGGDIDVRAGNNLDAGIYYIERGHGTLVAGNSIITNSTRAPSRGALAPASPTDPSPVQWLPTTLFLGKGSFDVSAGGDVLLGPTVNPFLLPVGLNNSFMRKSYFSTYAPDSAVHVTSLGGTIALRQHSTVAKGVGEGDSEKDSPILQNWMQPIHLLTSNPASLSFSQPWLRLAETTLQPFKTSFTLLPGTLRLTALSGDISLVGRFDLSPSPIGTIELAASGAINGLQPTGVVRYPGNSPRTTWAYATVNLSDASPVAVPGIVSPIGYQGIVGPEVTASQATRDNFLLGLTNLFAESGSSTGAQSVIQTQQALHGTSLLHAADREPIRLYAKGGDISGLTLFSAKAGRIVAANDISDVALYLQNNSASDVSIVSAGRDIIPSNANTQLRVAAQSPGNLLNLNQTPLAGDIQISGPGTLGVFAGRNLDLGTGANNADGTGVGLVSIGNARNPNLPFMGADLIATAGVGYVSVLNTDVLDAETFASQFIDGPDGARYLAEVAASNPQLAELLGGGDFETLDAEQQAKVALEVFFLVLRDAGRNSGIVGTGGYDTGFAAIDALFGKSETKGEIVTRSRDIRTRSGGSISLLAPGGGLTLANSTIGTPLAPPGIITEAGGNISIFTDDSVDIGISRIFTLRGGNQVIWSSSGDIAAGSSAKTVQSAPPTRVLIDAQTADLQVDLAGLATGGGIGVLATVSDVTPGSVDLIAPAGTVDAGDAGIRATGDLNIAAVQVLNADNIQAAGTTTGVPSAPPVSAPNLGGLAASNAAGAANAAATQATNQQRKPTAQEELPSIITVEVIGYGGGIEDEEEDKEERKKRAREAVAAS